MPSHPALGALRLGSLVTGVAADGRTITGTIAFYFGRIGPGINPLIRVGVLPLDAPAVFPEIHAFGLADLAPVADARSGR